MKVLSVDSSRLFISDPTQVLQLKIISGMSGGRRFSTRWLLGSASGVPHTAIALNSESEEDEIRGTVTASLHPTASARLKTTGKSCCAVIANLELAKTC
ncbi:hypothetical protein Baya_17150 [Bagarius yarrelli]|uniref:Uncharacterized protein n=1 Tax=Bagarius yarrelli TaxID=175774 RepID=A0A556VXI9_BAGYA|nr:hypothetical protein Baya_17150 [Bagarius yarrelli]